MKPSAKKRTQTVADDIIKQLTFDSIANKQYNEDIENDVDILAFEKGVTSLKFIMKKRPF